MSVLIAALGLMIQAPELPEPGAMIDQCLAEHTDWDAERDLCIGPYSMLCMDTRPDGYSTVGMVTCLQEEYEAWDERLNIVYARLRGDLEPDVFEALQNSQRAWLNFRETECRVGPAFVQGGTLASVLHADCFMRMTAERTNRLLGLETEGGF